MNKINITVHQRPLTNLFLFILMLFLALFFIIDGLTILYFIYMLIKNFIIYKTEADFGLPLLVIVIGGILLYISGAIMQVIKVIVESNSENEYMPIKRELENLVEKNEELEKELLDAKIEIKTLSRELQRLEK